MKTQQKGIIMSLKKIDYTDITDNPFSLIGDDWMLITSGTMESHNMMTASWGGLGILWHKPVSFIFVRPTRHTYNFTEENDVYTLNFLEEKYRDVLKFCGSRSGRDVNKTAETGLTPVESGNGCVYFAESRLVIECRKIYHQDIDPARFLSPDIDKLYNNDYHRMYVGEVIQCLSREK